MPPTVSKLSSFFKIVIMKLEKRSWTDRKEFVQKVDCILKIFSLVILITVAAFCTTSVIAQNNKDTVKSSLLSNGDNNTGDIFNQLREYSRPGRFHQLLGDLVGAWTFKGRAFSLDADSNKVVFEFNGTAVRNSFANGRYFIVDVTNGDELHKIQMPVQGGKTKEVIGKSIITEGYDNVKNKFKQTSISNHIGSDIVYSEGYYDSTTKTITFDFEQELVPGIRDKVRELFIMIDKDHYTIEYYQKKNEKYIKATEVNYTRAKGK
jgi:uncharacterized protein DUF1579